MPNLASNTISVLGGAAVGAIAAYLLDPDYGQARRRNIANTANEAVSNAGDVIRSSADSAKKMVGEVSEYAQQLADQVKSHAAHASTQAYKTADDGHRELQSSLQSLIGKAKDYAAHISDQGQSAANDLADRAKSSLQRQTGWEPARPHRSVTGITTGTVMTLALGAGTMFFLDPARGRGRRAWASDKINSWLRRGTTSATRYGRHLGNRVKGAVHDVRKAVPQEWSEAVDRAKDNAVSAVRGNAEPANGQ